MLESRPGIEQPTRDPRAGDLTVDSPGGAGGWWSRYTRSRQKACSQDTSPCKVQGDPLPNRTPNPSQGSEYTGWSKGNMGPHWAWSSAWLRTSFWPVSGHCTHTAVSGATSPYPLIHVLTLGLQHVTVGSSGDYVAGREGPVFIYPPLSCTSPGGYERGMRDPEWEAGAMLCRVHTWPEGKAQRHQQGQLEAQATSHHLGEVIDGLGLIGGFLYFSSLRPLVPCPGVRGRGRWPPGTAPCARHMGTTLTPPA